ncbi:MAG: NAD(P)-dependent oxidoreductase [Natronospirillum sp.]
MSKRLIAFLDQGTIPKHIQWPDPSFDHTWQSHDITAPEQRVERLKDVRIAITNKVVLDRAVLTQCPQLELIQVAATGANNVDLDACRELGIKVANVKGYARHAVAEWVIGNLLSLAWSLGHYRDDQRSGAWAESETFSLRTAPIREIRKMRVGILGKGDIGKGVARRLEAFGTDIVFLERPGTTPARAGYLPFDTALPQLDALVLTCPLTSGNAEFVDRALLQRMKPGAFLLNPSRGGLINEADLADVIKQQHLGGVALDVVSAEPISTDNPLFAVRDSDNLILTPHIGWSSDEALTELMRSLVDNLNRFAAGETAHCLV